MANGINVGISLPDSQSVNDTLTAARFIKKSMSRSSLTRMAKDTVMQFPLLISSGIESDEVSVISRALERQYAALMVSSMSLDAGVNINKYGSLRNYLKKFHSNDDIPANIQAAPVIGSMDSTLIPDSENTVKGLGSACWDIVEDKLCMESVNDIYRPYDRTLRVLEDNLNKMRIAKEAAADKPDINSIAKKIKEDDTRNGYGGLNANTEKVRDRLDSNGNVVVDASGKVLKETVKTGATVQSSRMNEMVKTDKLSGLEPTLINCTFVMHGGNGSSTQWTQNVVLGVKMMIRMIRSDFMTSNMADAAKNSNVIFKYIKWTKGEYGLLDLLFNNSENKEIATTSKNDSSHWWKALRRRKMINNITHLFEQGTVLPSTTIIMTSSEVQQVASLTGVDLSTQYNALKLLNKYYLLGFGIYDTESDILSMIFDGESDFSEVTLSSLKGNNNKEVSIMDSKEMRRMMGRV